MPHTVVCVIPRGGVVIGSIIASFLSLPLLPIVVKKIGAPGNPELAIGAVGSHDSVFRDEYMMRSQHVPASYIAQEVTRIATMIEEKETQFGFRADVLAHANRAIVTDDGVATGATLFAALAKIRAVWGTKKKDKHIIIAVPVIAKDTFDRLQSQGENIIALIVPKTFQSVGQFYREFPQVDDEEVIHLLDKRKE